MLNVNSKTIVPSYYKNQGLIESVVDTGNTSAVRSLTSGYVDSGDEMGYWIRGDKKIDGVKNVYSSYKNYKHEGAASVTSGTGNYVDGGYMPADVMSTAFTEWTSRGTNKANYRFR